MSLVAGVVTKVSASQNQISLSATAPTGGVDPLSYQWYRSTVSGFTPGVGNLIAGATALDLVDSSLIPSTQYYYVLVATDSDIPTPSTVAYAEFAIATESQGMNPNQFAQTSLAGRLDMSFEIGTFSAQLDASQVGSVIAGELVKIVPTSGKQVPKVVKMEADSDEAWGVVVLEIKSQKYVAGDRMEVAREGSVIFMYATGAIERGAQVQVDLSSPAAVGPVVGSSGACILGKALDQAVVSGDLIRVEIGRFSFPRA